MDALDTFVRLLSAAGYAGAIGLDRELRAKPAGLRTNIVVGVAAATFALLSSTAFAVTRGYDPSRMAAEVVTGVGFLGGGAIFAAGGKPHGLTTAAALWGSAAAGLAAGLGELLVGLALVLVTLLALQPLDWLARVALRQHRRADAVVHVVAADLDGAARVRGLLGDAGVRVVDLQLRPFGEQVALDVVVHGTREQIAGAVERIRSHVRFVSAEAVAEGRSSEATD